MRRLTLLLSLALALPLCAETKLSDLAWMSGHWAATIDDVEMEELWTPPRGGVLLGLHRDISKKRTSFEFLRIAETKDGIVFLAQPGGQRSEEHTSELQSQSNLVCRLLLEKKKKKEK